MMDDDDFYIDHQGAKMLFEAMMYAGGFRLECRRERRYSSSSPDLSPIRKRSISPECRKGEKELLPCERFQGKKNNYFEIAAKNAEELIKEEEEAKMKAEKKKAKKERQKMKKQLAKENNSSFHNMNCDNLTNKISSDMENLNIASTSNHKDTEGLDVNAAFVSKAVKKVKNTTIISVEPKSKQEMKDINYLVKKAEEYEKKQHYKEAVQYLSEAINLKPQTIDLILKRSFIYFELAKFEKSIRDAKKVIQYSSNNPHAYYRLGEGHFALSNLTEAEAAFTKLLTLKAYCEEAKNRIFSIRIKQLEEMGYHPNEAFAALSKSKNKTLDEAIDFLNELEKGKHTEELYYSDEDEDGDDEDEDDNDDDDASEDYEDEKSSESAGGISSSSGSTTIKPIEISNKSPILTNPKNPAGCNSLFVGNLKKDITYKELQDVFVKFGEIKSIKLTTEPNCYAFVNYEEPSAAGQAMEALQGSRWLVSTVPLIVKYPINVIKSLIANLKYPEVIMRQLAAPPSSMKPTPVRPLSVASDTASEGDNKSNKQIPVVQKPSPGKPRPPPKTAECFYWRTMGCTYGDKCFNLHIPEHKGIDMKPLKKQK